MWILDQIKEYDWILSHTETSALFPLLNESGISFVQFDIRNVVDECVTKIYEHRNEWNSSSAATCKVMLRMTHERSSFYGRLPVVIGTNVDDFLAALDDEVIDVDADLASLHSLAIDVLMAIPLVTFRCDEKQNLILALCAERIVWRCITLNENFLHMRRIPSDDDHRFQLQLFTRQFLFSMRPLLLNENAKDGLRRFLDRIFPFPADVNDIIADMARRNVTHITRKTFLTYGSGLLNYTVARLLRVGHNKKRTSVSLKRFYDMSELDRCGEFATVRRILASKGRIFSRKVCCKQTRSGRAY